MNILYRDYAGIILPYSPLAAIQRPNCLLQGLNKKQCGPLGIEEFSRFSFGGCVGVKDSGSQFPLTAKSRKLHAKLCIRGTLHGGLFVTKPAVSPSTSTYTLLYYSSFHFLFHSPNITPIHTLFPI